MTQRSPLPTQAALTLLLVLAAAPAPAAPAFTATELMRVQRLDEPGLSPDGREVVFALTRVDLQARTKEADLWVVSTTGGEPRRLAAHPASDTRPLFSPDGTRIAFLSARDGTTQVHVMPRTGGPARAVTRLAGGVESYTWIDDARLLLVAKVFPECGADDACNAERLAAAGKPSSARAYEGLLVRHWDTWDDGRRQHLLVAPLDGRGVSDLTPGPDDAPPFSLGGPDDFAVSPDGTEVCFSRKASLGEAWSTNADIWVVPTAGGQPRRVTNGPGYEGECRYSPDGRLLAWRFQARGGYESDRWQLAARDRRSGEVSPLTPDFDRQVDTFVFSPDAKTLYFTAEDRAQAKVFAVGANGGPVRPVSGGGGSFSSIAIDGSSRFLVASQSSLARPAELVRFGSDGSDLTRLTSINDEVLAPFGLGGGESVTYRGAAGKDVQAFVVRPPDFDPADKHPLLVLVHGGPQGAWNDAWGYRWNPQVFASAGYVVFMPNPRGSTGFGQEFTDDIRDDWGGRAYEDVMKGTDFAQTLPGVDPERVVAAGASYGGYMVDWIAGHTDRFKALVTHDGVFDLVSMYGGTEELWFPEWEFKGTYWTNPGSYERWNPRESVTSFKTPTLVIHGERDYRVPLEQGLAMFTALQRQGVPSRLLVFPDENHWVLKPWNSVRWYGEVIGWLDRWAKR